MSERQAAEPDNTAVRVALWRALHMEVDAAPAVFEDNIGLKLVAPDDNWRERGDMHPTFTQAFRASIVARARFIEDLVMDRVEHGVRQYVVLGAGLDTFAQRRPDIASQLRVFEVDRPATQAWKSKRLTDLGYGVPSWLKFVPVNFEAGELWWQRLAEFGFDPKEPAIVGAAGLSMYLNLDSIKATLRHVASLPSGTTLAMTFLLPIDMADPSIRVGLERAVEGARASGTPFVSFFMPSEIMQLARECGFKNVEHVSAAALAERYFSERTDGLRPPDNSEEFLVAKT